MEAGTSATLARAWLLHRYMVVFFGTGNSTYSHVKNAPLRQGGGQRRIWPLASWTRERYHPCGSVQLATWGASAQLHSLREEIWKYVVELKKSRKDETSRPASID